LKFLTAHVNTEPTWRGGEQQTLYLLEGLRRRGYPVALFSTAGTPLHDRARSQGFTTHHLRIRSEADVPAMFRLARILRELRPALMHMHTSHAHTIGVCAAVLAGNGMKRVVSRRVNFSIFRHSFFGLNWIKYCYGVDRYLTVSESVRGVLVRDGVDPARIRVVHSGVDPERFRGSSPDRRSKLLREWKLPDGIPLVGCIGALVRNKGIRYFVDAAASVLRTRDCAFVVVGEGELYDELSRRALDSGLGPRFRLVGFRSDVGDILSALDVFVLPTLEEGLGTSLLDAMLLERPTVATQVGGVPEVIRSGSNGLLVGPGDAPALARAIEALLADPKAARRYGEEGKKTVLESFSVDAMVEKTIQAYEDLLR
jgi:glycosyltransferase involved in cell wall biosynthesis